MYLCITSISRCRQHPSFLLGQGATHFIAQLEHHPWQELGTCGHKLIFCSNGSSPHTVSTCESLHEHVHSPSLTLSLFFSLSPSLSRFPPPCLPFFFHSLSFSLPPSPPPFFSSLLPPSFSFSSLSPLQLYGEWGGTGRKKTSDCIRVRRRH